MTTLLVIAALITMWLSIGTALSESNKTRCMTNERRIASALLLYCQDHDGRLPPPDYRTAEGEWRHWHGLLQSYLPPTENLLCPLIDPTSATEWRNGYPFAASYALNERFFGAFAPGPFPLENLELPQQTAMLVETAPFSGTAGGARRIYSTYSDIAGRPEAYPAPHGGKMNVAAADGHVVSVTPAHYAPGGHDARFGRLGGTIYNWNGGHPNGDTSGPPRE